MTTIDYITNASVNLAGFLNFANDVTYGLFMSTIFVGACIVTYQKSKHLLVTVAAAFLMYGLMHDYLLKEMFAIISIFAALAIALTGRKVFKKDTI